MGDTKNSGNINDAFSTYLKQNKLRETYERKIIVGSIKDCDGHFDLEELAAVLANKGERVSRATLYNTISLLMKSGLIRRQQFANGQYHYESVLRLPLGNQLHLVCTSCGKVTDLRSNSVIKVLGSMKFGSFSPEYISMSVYGLCSKCACARRKLSQKKTGDKSQSIK